MLRTPSPTRPSSLEDLLPADLIARLDRLDITSRKVLAGKLKGERRSKKRGESVEFADHRPYVVGDDLRHIDWNIFGRLDRLFLKLFLEEEDLSLHLVIDASASADTGEPNKFFLMQQLAMALGYIGLSNYNRVACTAIGASLAPSPRSSQTSGESRGEGRTDNTSSQPQLLTRVTDLRGKRRTHDLARFLCNLEPGSGIGETDSPDVPDFAEACKRIALTRRGKGVMVLLSDMLIKEGYDTGLRLLVGRGYDLFVMQVLSPQELEPELAGDLRLKDLEDGDRADITVSAPLLKKYKQNLAAYTTRLREFCARRDITQMTVRSDTPMDTLILDYLRRRGLVR
ncbi:MAG: DUF58 domain-containing protein [Planctomycetota bacterium]